MLLTTCPNCEAQFKVTPEQLNIRQGRVMCGRCRNVFNAFQSLERVDSAFMPQPTPVTEARPELDAVSDIPGTSTSLERPAATAEIDLVVDEPMPILETGTESAHDTTPPAVPLVEQGTPAKVDEIPPKKIATAQNEEYQFEAQHSPAHWTWRLGVTLLVLGLAAQTVYFMRTPIVSNYPELRPYLTKACEWLACTLAWDRDESALKVESSDLIEEIGTPGRFLLTATISNRAKKVQDFPHIELTLTDTNNQTLTRRVLQPRDYLGRPLQRDEGMAPAAETSFNLRLEASSSRAAGYHLLLFFP